MDAASPARPTRRIAISTGTFVRGLVMVVLVWAWLRLWQWVLIALIGASLAIAIDPAVRWLERRGIRRGYAAPLLVLGGVAALIAFFVISAAALGADARLLERRVVAFYGSVMANLPPAAQQAVGSALPSADAFWAAGQALIGGVAGLVVAVALTVYFLLDGRRTFEWLVAFAPAARRPQVRQTADGAAAAIAAYMRGNLITSALTAVSTWVVLWLLGVPAALLLAILAGVCDFLPVVGVLLSAGPAILLALMVSPTAAVIVAAFFLAYNMLQAYYLQPKVYGRAMRLSDLAVIGAFLVGAELGGVLGALVALPLAATYPVIERVWLRDSARPDLPQAHERIAGQDEH
jgi:predicted PurR-regulated permease PerM